MTALVKVTCVFRWGCCCCLKGLQNSPPGRMTIRALNGSWSAWPHSPEDGMVCPEPPSRDLPFPRWWASGIWTTGPSVVKASDLGWEAAPDSAKPVIPSGPQRTKLESRAYCSCSCLFSFVSSLWPSPPVERCLHNYFLECRLEV